MADAQMQPELALQKLNELREVVDGDVAEMVDTLATLMILKQDMGNPMFGAKVTYHERPPTKDPLALESEDELPDGWEDHWQYRKAHTAADSEHGEVIAWFDEKEDPDAPDLISRRAIVFEPNVAEAPDGTYWDPNRKEYTSPDEYPMGTVNLILPGDDDRAFGEDYTYGVRVETSVTPADGAPSGYDYTPGWD